MTTIDTGSRLRDALEGQQAAQAAADDQDAKREAQRQHIRDKLSEVDRAFLDAVRDKFPGSKLVGIRFNDGEQFGRVDT